jgi:CRP-like cAMP-binding protein
MQPREILGSIPFFADVLSPADLDRLAARAIAVHYKKGADLLREDDPGQSMFVIVGGEVVVTTGKRPKAKEVARLGKGAIVGEMSLLTGAHRAATVTAVTPVEALEITKAALEPILAASPSLVERFGVMLEKRQKELDRLYGSGRLAAFGLQGANFSSLIRGFFGGTI